jgi:high-affinity iron transporter
MQIFGRTLEAMIVTLREGIEVALVVGVLLAYLRRTGRYAYVRPVLLGLVAAGLASLASAPLIQHYGLDPDNPLAEGTVMLAAAALVTSLVVWMWRTGKNAKRRLERRLDSLVGDPEVRPVGYRAALGVFLFSFLMVLREGVETVLFLAALSGTVGGSPVYNAVGGGIGLLLAGLFGVLLVRGSVRLNLHRFFAVTGAVLMLLVVKLVAGGLHEFFEIGLLPHFAFGEEGVELFARPVASIVILALLVLLPGLSVAWDWWRQASPAQPSRQPNNVRL